MTVTRVPLKSGSSGPESYWRPVLIIPGLRGSGPYYRYRYSTRVHTQNTLWAVAAARPATARRIQRKIRSGRGRSPGSGVPPRSGSARGRCHAALPESATGRNRCVLRMRYYRVGMTVSYIPRAVRPRAPTYGPTQQNKERFT